MADIGWTTLFWAVSAAAAQPQTVKNALPIGGFSQPSSICTDELVSEHAQLGEACKATMDCGYGMNCTDGKCACLKNFIPTRGPNDFLACYAAPSYQEFCSGLCSQPFVCLKMGFGEERRCGCPPFLIHDVLEGCIRDCPAGYVNAPSPMEFECVKTAKLTEDCDYDRQCSAAFSFCNNGTCACISGFMALNGKCLSTVSTCPKGSPVRSKDGAALLCTRHMEIAECNGGHCTDQEVQFFRRINSFVKEAPSPGRIYRDGCPNGTFCHAIPTFGEDEQGVCCPMVKAQCPLGVPLSDVSCTPDGRDGVCPLDTHYCHTVETNGYVIWTGCCPKPCPRNYVLSNGECYKKKELEYQCEVDIQCIHHDAACINGTCLCPEGFKNQFDTCIQDCAPDQVLLSRKCHSKANLQQPCKHDEQCPEQAFCSSTGTCKCRCWAREENGKCVVET